MTQEPKSFTVVDPRTFDGDPFEVGERACKQAEAVARVLAGVTETANIMARNAEMERKLYANEDADAAGWDESPYGRRFARAAAAVREVERELSVLGKAAGFNPKKAR